ncbi:MAG: hypothetical protein WCX97_02945 [Candidatus Magasanikbacteria bacterium]
MFGRKKIEDSPMAVKVHTIPMEFYGGANPVVKFKKVEKEVAVDSANHVLTRAEKNLLHQATAVGGNRKYHPANFFASQKFLFVSIGVLFVVFVVMAGLYYYFQEKTNQPSSTPPAPEVIYEPPIEVVTPVIVPETLPETITTTESVAPLSLAEAPLDFLSTFLGDGVDLDKDGLTDLAEEVFRTDLGVPDTDADNYSDSTEIYNLYNPAGFAPVKIIDSGLVKDFSNQFFGYQVYYPSDWAVGIVDTDERDVLFSTLNGENIEVRVFDLVVGQTFSDWFTIQASREKFSDLTTFESAFQEKGLRRNDNLVYYFSDNNHVYVILYHTTDSVSINYRSVITMMARSFRLQGNTVSLPIPVNLENSETLNDAAVDVQILSSVSSTADTDTGFAL